MFSIDPMSRKPVYEQLIDQLEQFILTGALQAGEQIPSVRNLSVQLFVNPNTIQKAYNELDSRGLIYAVPGRGCFVAEDALERISARKRENITLLDKLVKELALAGVSKETIVKHVEAIFSQKRGEETT